MTSPTVKILLTVLLAMCTISQDIDYSYTYQDFMRQYNRNYTGQEKAEHEQVFNKNYQEYIRRKEAGQDVVVNDYFDWTQEQMNNFFNIRPEELIAHTSSRPVTSGRLFASPPSFDWRTFNRVTSVKNQGGCGSCWAFATTAQYQSLVTIGTNGTQYDLAEQYALQCDKSSFGCNGGYMSTPLRLFRDTNGIPAQSSFPYSPNTVYQDICNATSKIKVNQTINSIYSFGSISVEDLQQDLISYGPITVGIWASDPSFDWAGPSGLISCGPVSSINHAVLLIGYNTTHWFIKNSWGTSNWGNNGFGYVDKTVGKDCNIRISVTQMRINFGWEIAPNPQPPNPTPTPTNQLNLTITMSDTYGDGWNGNVLGIKQNNSIVGTFGDTFTTGSAVNPVYIVVQGDFQAEIVVLQAGTKSNQVRFVVRAPNGTIIYQKSSTSTFTTATIFSTFCPINNCPLVSILSITMTDVVGDGWNGNVLSIMQNGSTYTFGNTFTSGASSGPVFITVLGNLEAQIGVSQLGTKSEQVKFVVKSTNGTTIHQRTTGAVFSANKIFSAFCPRGGCGNTQLVEITMTDTKGDGWNGNILAIKQNDVILGTFGGAFTTGTTTDPVYIRVQIDLAVQAIVSSLGTATNEVLFVVRALNGTLFYQRTSGALFTAVDIFFTMCPNANCLNTLKLTINMTDSFGDGWNGNTLGVRQNDGIIGTFNLGSGSTGAPKSILVLGNYKVELLVFKLGSKSNQIGFVVTAPNGTIIFQRKNGTLFNATTIFWIFCPVANCPGNPTITHYLTITDAYGDGWQGTVLAFKQGTTILDTFTLVNGSSAGPTSYDFQRFVQINITVYTLGNYTNEVGFVLRNAAGGIVFQKYPGAKFFGNTILGSFCADCLNLRPTAAIQAEVEDNNTPIQSENQKRSYMIATYILAACTIILLVVSIILAVKLAKVLNQGFDIGRNIPAEGSVQSAKHIQPTESIVGSI